MSEKFERLKEERLKKGLTQSDMAELMGVKLRQYQRYESGEQGLGIQGWIFLANFYQVSLDYLTGLSDDPARR